MDLKHSMQDKPMLWVGVAAGAGFTVGLLGRFLSWRKRRATPDLVIVDATC